MSLYDLIRARYPAENHVTMAEVRDAAGFSASRSCDAISISTWPSRGLLLRGFEIKASRADWLRELREPSKAETFSVFCDEWYVVADTAKIVQMDELPDTWGLLVRTAQRLDCVKPAAKNPTPSPIDRGLLVALLKRAVEQGPTAKTIEAAHAQGLERGKSQAVRAEEQRSAPDYFREQFTTLEAKVKAFEAASGVQIDGPFHLTDSARVGAAVKLVMAGDLVWQAQRARNAARDLQRTANDLLSYAKTLETEPALPSTETPP